MPVVYDRKNQSVEVIAIGFNGNLAYDKFCPVYSICWTFFLIPRENYIFELFGKSVLPKKVSLKKIKNKLNLKDDRSFTFVEMLNSNNKCKYKSIYFNLNL